jgi:hypothetical protein
MSLYGVYSQVQGPDGNGLLLPSDPALGGHGGNATTTNATPQISTGGFVPEDLKTTVVWADVQARVGAVGTAPTAVWSARIKGTFIRSGNSVSQVGAGISTEVESSPTLARLSASWTIDTSVTPNAIVPVVKGLTATTILWQWKSFAPESL